MLVPFPSLADQAISEFVAAMKCVLTLFFLLAIRGHSKMMVALLVFVDVGVSCDDKNLEGHEILLKWKECPMQNDEKHFSL